MIKHVMIVETPLRKQWSKGAIDIPASRCEVIVAMEDQIIVQQCAAIAAKNKTGRSKMLGGLVQGKVIKRSTL